MKTEGTTGTVRSREEILLRLRACNSSEIAAIAVTVGVEERSVWRWKAGEHGPAGRKRLAKLDEALSALPPRARNGDTPA